MSNSKLKYLSSRVSVKEGVDRFSMVITNSILKWKVHLLQFWMVSWGFCGLVFMYFLSQDGEREFKLGLVIMLVFWALFMFKSIRVYRWRTVGYEKIALENGVLHMGRYFGKRGLPKSIELSNVTDCGRTQLTETSFAGFFQNSFWVIGGEKLMIRALGKDHIFGCQLNEKEQDQVLKVLTKALEKANKRKEKLVESVVD
ncbi:MAG: hypothetical protein ACJAY8_000434 [Sphingobacteriales bacterium]|jgi:hypothetical protein